MRALPALALATLLLLPGCARVLPTARPQGVAQAMAAASTIELRRAVRVHLVMAFDWADADRDGLLVMAEAERLGIDQADFLRRDRDQNGALGFTEVQGADGLTAEVHRLRELETLFGRATELGYRVEGPAAARRQATLR